MQPSLQMDTKKVLERPDAFEMNEVSEDFSSKDSDDTDSLVDEISI